MPSLTLRQVTVDFPFSPYECQKDYMTKVIECLQTEKNGVLESPTGTGKTLCLLCATLAWREYFKDSISAHKIAERLDGQEMFKNKTPSSWGAAATDGETPGFCDVPKIIYASRTHSQLSQVIGELKSTSYRPKVCVLGSREQLCIDPEVMRQETNHVKVNMCKRKVATRTCVLYNNVEEKSTDKDLVNSISDVEDLVNFGKKHRACPYYLSRSLKQQAEIIFMPYNYLLDPKSRRAHNIDLKGAIIIFDEAHNVEKTCEESTSFDLTPYDLASAINSVDKVLAEQAQEASRGDAFSEEVNVESLTSVLKMETVAKVKQILLDLEGAIDSYNVSSNTGITKPGSFIYELFQKAHLTYRTKDDVYGSLEQIIGHLAGHPGIFLNTTGLQKLADIIQLVFPGEPPEDHKEKQIPSHTTFFKVHIHRDNSFQKKKQNDGWASSSSKKEGNILSYWCFSPGFSMQELVNQKVRSIILTSGTLSPLSSFTSEMRIPFPVCLENSHVIERDQVFVGIVEKGPDGVMLSSAFDRRFLPENMASLGNTVANLSRVVPQGLLVFFPSFPLMEKTLEFWRANGHADRIESVKPIFVESKGKSTFTEVVDGYYQKVDDPNSKGGSFFAVCRGKASEGLDFADAFGRAVIITGLPFPPRMDPRVIQKMQFLDQMNSKKEPGVKYLSGQEWYRQQAFRAVNQAIGRVIRHKEDYGAIFLCDERFKNSQSQLPLWLRPYARVYNNFGNVVRDVTQFFRVAQKMRPTVKKKKNAATETRSSVCSSESQPGSSSQRVHAQKAKMLDTHMHSLKRRRLNDHSALNGMARICIEYEAEVPESQKRPATLLDALECTNLHSGQDDVVDKVSHLSTVSLQYDKKMDDKLRGGKRKIKLVQEQIADSEEDKTDKAKNFLSEMKRSLSQVNFERILRALHTYKKTDNLDVLLTELALLTEDANTHSLLRGFYQFVRPHHKKKFDDRSKELTGQGCGYQPDHSLSKEEKEKLTLQSATERKTVVAIASSSDTPASSHLNANLLNKGGHHLTHQGLKKPQSDSAGKVQPAPSNEVHATFLAHVKKALGAEKSTELFQAIQSYKKTDNYENLVSTVVNLFTEKDENFCLLTRFAMFIRPHHKRQYKDMLVALTSESVPVDCSSTNTDQPQQALFSPLKTQTKISNFCSSNLRK
ncbi:regulator of telomere elongation helicase 1 isoform X2 [Genypterus blacodes]|uniref:regulator of telomere elongation helicase 1 isoform X2 n=1 Tax=Genypterus blacodes TaxID=154954 RepID=UPI003F775B18